jgi:drug/metabolite transporter (DMT)-like permease
LLAWWILGDEPSAQTLSGGALVLVGMALAVRAERT